MARIIALVGMCGAGKSEAARFLERKGYIGVHFGSLTMEEMKKKQLAINAQNEKKIREALRKEHGMAAFAMLCIPKIQALLKKTEKVYIDGLYSWEEYKVLQRIFKELILVQIYSPKKLRYTRLAGRSKRPLTQEEARNRDIAEIENSAKGGPLAFCDYLVVNDGGLEKLSRQMEEIIA